MIHCINGYAKKSSEKNSKALRTCVASSAISVFCDVPFWLARKKKANIWSDIDVAVVSDKLQRNLDKNRLLLWDLRMSVDTRIEPHGFTVKEFASSADPIVYEIKKTGVRIE
ncbi:hypothetical protein HY621_01480 [Candidatus Uhrbacteria bacterium]|nr:hypothetical protein [Candidatus Uhrbacteria bacterium]